MSSEWWQTFFSGIVLDMWQQAIGGRQGIMNSHLEPTRRRWWMWKAPALLAFLFLAYAASAVEFVARGQAAPDLLGQADTVLQQMSELTGLPVRRVAHTRVAHTSRRSVS